MLTQPDGPKVLTAMQQTPRVSAVPNHNDLAFTQNIHTGDVSIAANVVYDEGLRRMYRSRSQLAYQANSSGCSYHGLSYVVYDVVSFPAAAMSCVFGLCSRHPPESGYIHRDSQIPWLYSYSPEISITSTSTSII